MEARDIKETRFLLGTIVEFTVYTDDESRALKAIAEAAQVMRDVEQAFTIFGVHDNSVKQFNRAKVGQVVVLQDEVDALLRLSLMIHQQTQGAFDPALGTLNQLWGFSGEIMPTQPPSQQHIQQALAKSGSRHVDSQGRGWVKQVQGLQLDFGAIAKGYAIDQGVKVLKKHGFHQAIINAGGDMMVLGTHGDKPWRIAIRHPRADQPLGWVEIDQDSSIVTSGDYERFYMYKGRRYHHILDPQTGKPSSASQSVTVIAANATLADAWSTALFVLGSKQGIDIVQKRKAMAALWVKADGSFRQTQGIELHHAPVTMRTN